MKDITSVTPNYGGISYQRLEKEGLQWPCPEQKHPGTPILHIERFPTNSGKAKFAPLLYKPSAELPDHEYPLLLTTDRSLYQYHTGTMTHRVEGLDVLSGTEVLHINLRDASQLGIDDNEMVQISSRRGTVTARTKVSDLCPPGVVSLTFHFPDTPTRGKKRACARALA